MRRGGDAGPHVSGTAAQGELLLGVELLRRYSLDQTKELFDRKVTTGRHTQKERSVADGSLADGWQRDAAQLGKLLGTVQQGGPGLSRNIGAAFVVRDASGRALRYFEGC